MSGFQGDSIDAVFQKEKTGIGRGCLIWLNSMMRFIASTIVLSGKEVERVMIIGETSVVC